MAAELESPESRKSPAGIAFDFPISDSPSASPPAKIPRRILQRLRESKSPLSAEEIETKLKEADLRRQQFHEWLSSKARQKHRSPSWSPQDEELGQRLEAKLYAAEQKRLDILEKERMRLIRMDQLRQAAKTAAATRIQKEREELGTKVESRVQKAELNRMLLLKAYRQRRAAAQEKKATILMQKRLKETKYKEWVQTAILRKRAAAEKKRLGLLEAEKIRAHVRVMEAHRVAKFVSSQREIERRNLKEQLENRLQRAKRQRSEYLRLRGSMHSCPRTNCNKMHEQGDLLARKLARYWRRFVTLKGTTFDLAKAYSSLGINEKSVRSLPFEQLAGCIESSSTLRIVKALLDRLELRFTLSQSRSSSSVNIDHLLKRLASTNERRRPSKSVKSKGANKGSDEVPNGLNSKKMLRYPARLVLCAYMILGHPDVVFNGHGEKEMSLAESAAKFVQEFELLIEVILDGHQESASLANRKTFRSQLLVFDGTWCTYLYDFVVWKVKDARSLEDDLVRAACQLELSMMKTCKLTIQGNDSNLSHDMRSIQKQVSTDQKLLHDQVQNLSGAAGIERMECALSKMRTKFFEAKENRDQFVSPTAHISSSPFDSSIWQVLSDSYERIPANGNSSSVVCSLFKSGSSLSSGSTVPENTEGRLSSSMDAKLVSENELLVNEIVHQGTQSFADIFDPSKEDQGDVKAKIKETMEKVFWDGVAEALTQDEPDYSRVVQLVKEVRDELSQMAPKSWRQEIHESIDLDILHQVLKLANPDVNYLGRILEYALVTLQKLSSPANEEEIKKTHTKLLKELADIANSCDKSNSTFVSAMVKGLRFVLEQIQTLKQQISKARIRIMEPVIRGPAGFEYLRKAFSDRFGDPSTATNSLPLTKQWLSSVMESADQEWNEHQESVTALTRNQTGTLSSFSQDFTPHGPLRTGGAVPMASSSSHLVPLPLTFTTTVSGVQQTECKGEMIDLLVRIGLLKLVNGIEGLTPVGLPETLKLNMSRLRAVQGQLQKIIVLSTSMLVFRQILLTEDPETRPGDIETEVADFIKRLSQLLDNDADVGIAEIVETINSLPTSKDGNTEIIQRRKEMMASMSAKSLRDGDPVFSRVTHAVRLAMRGVVLGGSGGQGRKLAEMALRRLGAALLTERVVEAAKVLVVVATVSGRVHGPWYKALVAEM